MTNPETLAFYLDRFGNLRRKGSKQYGQAPHKPVLVLALLDEIERGAFPDNLITPTLELIAGFHTYWNALVSSSHWGATMNNPFRHLYQEGWWHFVKNGEVVSPGETTPSLKYMAETFDGVRLSPELWELLQDRVALNALRNHVLQTYFSKQEVSEVVRETKEAYFLAEAEKLKQEAQRPFKTRVREQIEEAHFVRHALFPRVIRAIYHDACAVCGLSVHLTGASGGAILDGSHIVPFAISHNDDPRNGVSLCKNHHWGFDRGWFSLSNDYRVLVSPYLADAAGYITANVALRLPVAPILHPAPDALEWHRENVFKR